MLGDVASDDFVLVSCERCQDFVLLALGNLDEIKGSSQLGCDLIEFCGRDAKTPMGFFKTERRRAGLGGLVANASPATALRLVIEVETACAMVASTIIKIG